MTKQVTSEVEYRKNILAFAQVKGCLVEVRQIFQKYDDLLKHCTNKEERDAISKMGIVELYKLLDCYGGLSINGQNIINYENPDKGLIKS